MWWDIVSKPKTISSVELVYFSFYYSFCFVLYTIGNWRCYSKVVFYMCFVYFEVNVWYKMSCCKKNSWFCSMLTLFKCPLITKNKLSSVTRNRQIYIMPLDTLKIGIYKLNNFMNWIKVKRNNLLNSISRAWCKTIVTPYIKWGSYNNFAPSPRYTVLFLQTFVLKRHPM